MASRQSEIIEILNRIEKSLSGIQTNKGETKRLLEEERKKIEQEREQNKKNADEFIKEKNITTPEGLKGWYKAWKNAKQYTGKEYSGAETGTTNAFIYKAATSVMSSIEKTVSGAMNMATKTVSDVTTMVFTFMKNSIRRKEATLNASAELQKRELQVYGKTLRDAAQIMADNVTGKILDTAYNSLNAVMEGGRRYYMKSIEDHYTMSSLALENMKITVDSTKAAINGATGIAKTVSSALGPLGVVVSGLASIGSDITQQALDLKLARMEYFLKVEERKKELTNETIEQINAIGDPYGKMSQDVTKSFYDLADQSYNFGRELGLNGEQLQKYTKIAAKTNLELSKVGLDFNDLYKMQDIYGSQTGRMGLITGGEGVRIGALSMRTGASTDEITQLMSGLQLFNISIDSGTEMMYKMSDTAVQMGLSAKKFTKDVAANLKLAEKYQFKGGVKGLADMVLKAQKLRFNIGELDSVLSKMRTGNIEDVMKKSAELNVLGGNMAIYSDPFSMAYNAWVNPQGYMENLNRMVEGYGTFNKKTGETEFNNVYENMMLARFAQTTNQSEENVKNQIRQKNKEKVLRQQYGGRLGKYTDILAQNAVVDEKTGKWQMKVMDQKGGTSVISIDEFLSKSEKEREKMMENLYPEDAEARKEKHLETIEEYVSNISNFFSMGQAQTAEEKRGLGTVMASEGVYESLKQMSDKLVKLHEENITNNLDNYVRALKATSDATWRAQKAMNEIGGKRVVFEAYVGMLKANLEQMEDLRKDLTDYTTLLGNSLKDFAKNPNLKTIKEVVDKHTDTRHGINQYSDKLYYDILEDEKVSIKEWNGLEMNDKWNVLKNLGYKGFGLIKAFHKMNKGALNYVKPVNDVIISPKNGVFETHPQDTIIASRPGGSIDMGERERTKSYTTANAGNTNLTVNGTLKLDTGSQSIDLMELIRNNPVALRELTKEVIIEGSRTMYGGKPQYAPNRYTFS